MSTHIPSRQTGCAALAAHRLRRAVVETLEGRRLLSVSVDLTDTIHDPAAVAGGELGGSVAAQGDWVLLGQPNYDDPTLFDPDYHAGVEDVNSGRAVLINRARNKVVTIANPAPFRNDMFGSSVAILGNGKVAIASVEEAETGVAGAVYVFDADFLLSSTSDVPAALAAPTRTWLGTADSLTQFGFRIAAFGADDVLIYTEDLGTDPAGHGPGGDASGVGMYDSVTGNSIPVFDAGVTLSGRNMAVDGNRALFSYVDGSLRTKVAEVQFTGTSWSWVRTYDLLAQPAYGFGPSGDHALALAGTTVLVGSVDHDLVYQFDATGSTTAPVKTYAAPAGGPSGALSLFGAAVAVAGEHVVVTDPGTQASRAYVYGLGGASAAPIATLGATLGDAGGGNAFGHALATPGGGRFVVTDPWKDQGALADAGAAFTFAIVSNQPAPQNLAPVVSAGPDRSVTNPASASLDGTVSDDGLPAGGPLTTTWSVVSGPGNVTFAAAGAVDTTASFSAAGTYVLRLTASDGALSAADDVTVTVSPDPRLNASFNATAYGPDGRLHVAWYDTVDGRLRYQSRSTLGVWSAVIDVDRAGGGGLAPDVGQYVSMAVAADGTVGLAYYESTNGNLRYTSGSGSSWVARSVETAGDVGQYPSIAFGANNVPHLSYYDVTDSALRFAFWTGTGWSLSTIDNAADTGKHSSLHRHPNGGFAVAYYSYNAAVSGREVRYAQQPAAGGSWSLHSTTVTGETRDLSLDFDAAGRPALSYYHAPSSALGYARRNNAGTWSSSLIDNESGVSGKRSHLRFNGNNPEIVFEDETDHEVERIVGSYSSTSDSISSWTNTVLYGNAGTGMSAAWSSSGTLTVSFIDSGAGDLLTLLGL